MMKVGLFVTAFFLAASSQAQTFSVFIEGPADANERALIEQGARKALKDISSLSFHTLMTGKTRCSQGVCWLAAMEKQPSLHILVVTQAEGKLRALWIDRLIKKVSEPKQVSVGVPLNDATSMLLKAVIPAYVARGYARVEWNGKQVWGFRLNGNRLPIRKESHLVVPAGNHTLDVELASGESLLFPLKLREAENALLSIEPWAQTVNPSARGRTMRAVSYGLWTTGAVALGASFVAATLSREASARLTPCEGPDRTCLTVSQAHSIQHVAKARANQANLLLISGATLATAGVGLFVWQWVIP